MRKIAVLNQKGGVGKTTTVANTAAFLAGMGLRVLVVDLDPQAHLTIHFGVEPESVEAGSYKVVSQAAGIEEELVNVRENIWLLAANINLVGAESELVSVVGRETIFREAVEPIEGKFDYMLVDCAPSLGLLTLNALAACDEVLIPLQPHFLALQGFGKLLQTIDLVNKRINPNLKVLGVLLCMYDTRTSLSVEVRADIEKFLNGARGTNSAWAQAQLLPVYIRRNVKLAEAPSYGKTIFEYEKDCHGAEDYKKVAEFISGRLFPGSDNKSEQAKAEEKISEPQQRADLQSGTVETNQQAELQVEEGIKPEHIISELKNQQQPDIQQENSQKTAESAVPPTE